MDRVDEPHHQIIRFGDAVSDLIFIKEVPLCLIIDKYILTVFNCSGEDTLQYVPFS